MIKTGPQQQTAGLGDDCEEARNVVERAEQSLRNGDPLPEELVDQLIKYELQNGCGTRHDRFRLLKEHYLIIPVEQLRAKDVQRLGRIRDYADDKAIESWLMEIDDRLTQFIEKLDLPSDDELKIPSNDGQQHGTTESQTNDSSKAIEEALGLSSKERTFQQVLGSVSGASIGFIAFGLPGVVGGLVLGYVLTHDVGPNVSEPQEFFDHGN